VRACQTHEGYGLTRMSHRRHGAAVDAKVDGNVDTTVDATAGDGIAEPSADTIVIDSVAPGELPFSRYLAALIAIPIGAALMWFATIGASYQLWLAGVAICAVGLALAGIALDGWCTNTRRRWLTLVVGIGLVSSGSFVAAWAYDRQALILGVAGITTATIGLLNFGVALLSWAKRHPERWVFSGLTLVALGAVTTVWAVPRPIGVDWVLPVVFVGLGIGLFHIGIGPFCVKETASQCVIWGLVATGVGAAAILAGAATSTLAPVVVGVLLLALGLAPLSVGVLRLRPPWLQGTVLVPAGVLVLSMGLLAWPVHEPSYLRWIAAGLLAIIAGLVPWRGGVFVLLVVAAFILVWSLTDRVDPADEDPNPDATSRILALGDSYTSGEGSTGFFPGTSVKGVNQCRRASTAYPYLLAERLDMGLDFFACSGAKTSEIHTKPQMPNSPPDVAGGRPQLDNLTYYPATDLVLVSIGGNDALFGEIGIACVSPGSCTDFRDHWLTEAAHIGRDVRKTFEKIRTTVGESTPIVAVPYPLVLTESSCDWSALGPREHAFLVELITVLDDRIRWAAEAAGVNFFERGVFAFREREICRGSPDDTAMNFFNFQPTQGSFFDRINPANWVHGTFHPNVGGHVALANAFQPWLESLLARVATGGRPNPEPDEDAEFALRQVRTVGTVLDDTADLPPTLDCPVNELSVFATIIPLQSDATSFALNTSADDLICYTDRDGVWRTWPHDVGDDDVVRLTDDGIRIHPEAPINGWTQEFIYGHPGGSWQRRIVEFCDKKPTCPKDPDSWIRDRLIEAGRSAAVPALLMFFGGLLIGLGTRRLVV
jgi:lysophospholipase L1-like esterase